MDYAKHFNTKGAESGASGMFYSCTSTSGTEPNACVDWTIEEVK